MKKYKTGLTIFVNRYVSIEFKKKIYVGPFGHLTSNPMKYDYTHMFQKNEKV